MPQEELLKPRYKVIADYPNSIYALGHVIELYHERNKVTEGQIKFYNSYPHLFKKLEWWQERKIEEMPEYLKVIKKPHKGEVLKVSDYKKGSHDLEIEVNWDELDLLHFAYTEPATLEEYESQSKK